ncbi:hypothetical protein JKA74_18955 [Marivirga sp. S37H4]|uniref:Cyclic nucleotide-binding domain-containing protein n=1 Tax=Marivirga aurantiaca TaxID=2802615 RepID=A0A935CB57_9BACT|nr:MFS transporter [Marivirga aurantiaca]MBK6267131.1 hypothetical protein [Marivirga aurantiaca]
MKKLVLNILNAEAVESKRVFLLLLMGFFMGFFISGLSVGAESLFLNNFREESDLPLAILIAGLFGVIATAIFNYFQSKVSFQRLATGTFLIIFGILASVEVAYIYLPDVKPLYFLTFTIVLPFTYLILLIFWGAFSRLFDLRQSKRIIGGIDTGQLSASIIALLLVIPFMLNSAGFTEKDLITLSMVSIGGMFLAFTWLMNSCRQHLRRATGNSFVPYKKVFSDKYMRLMISFVVISMIAVNFIDYSFLSVTSAQFTESNLALFLTYFNGTVIIFSFLFQTFATDKIIALYGLRVSLLINPILILLITAAACFIGAGFGYTPANPTFIFFFVIIAVSKLFVTSLKDALDEPAFKLYFLPLEEESRFDIQTKIQGVITAFAGLIAGAVILLLNNIEIFNLLTISVAVIPLLLIWYYVTRQMHSGYKSTLKNTLAKNKEKSISKASNEYSVSRLLLKQLESEDETKKLYSLKLMEKLEPQHFEAYKKNFKGKASLAMADYLGNDKSGNPELSNHILKKLADKAMNESRSKDVAPLSFDELSLLCRALEPQKRQYAAKLFNQYADAKNIFLLIDLLKDANLSVRMEAIHTARLLKRRETWNVLIDMLDSVKFGHAASAALIAAGEPVLQSLESAFHKSGQSDKIMIAVIRIMSKIGGEEAKTLLLKKIDYPDKRIVHQMLTGFGYTDFNAEGNQAQIILQLIDEEIGKAAWNLAARIELPKEEKYALLKQAFKEEINKNYEQIFMLLSLVYDTQSVSLVKENILSETSDGIAYGLELLDMFVSPDLKPKLFPLADDISITEKLNLLENYYPRERFEPLELLNNILNRDYNQLSRWVKACALYNLASQEDYQTQFAVIGHLFNKDKLLQEVAAWLVYHRNPEQFAQIFKRLPEAEREELVENISRNKLDDGLSDGHFLLVEIVMFLKQLNVFSQINGSELCDLADNTKLVMLAEGETINLTLPENNAIYVVAKGKVLIKSAEDEDYILEKGSVFGELFVPEKKLAAEELLTIEQAVLFQLNINNFYTLMAQSGEFTKQIFTAITETQTVEI